MKKVLIISAVFPPEPVVSANLSYDIANTLSEIDNVTVISPKPSRPFGFRFKSEKLSFGFNLVQLDSFICASSNLTRRFEESYSFGKYSYQYIVINHTNIDVIYANTWPLFGQYFALKAARKYNVPIIIHIQDIYPESLANKIPWFGSVVNYLLRPMDAWILRNATKVIAISEKMKDYLTKTRNINPSHIEVVINWQDEQPFLELQENSILPDKKTPFTYMYLGNIGPVAGCDLLIDAFGAAKNQNNRLIIAGSGSMKENLIKHVSNQDIKNVEFWPVPEGLVPATQAQADILLLPVKKGAASTSIPSKLPAYMFSAKPIIATVDHDSDTANAIRESGCGWVIEPENPTALAALMQKVAAMPKDELHSMGMKGREYALKHFSKQANLAKLLAVIEQTVKQ